MPTYCTGTRRARASLKIIFPVPPSLSPPISLTLSHTYTPVSIFAGVSATFFCFQHICRSSTLAGWGELYGRTGYNYIFSGTLFFCCFALACTGLSWPVLVRTDVFCCSTQEVATTHGRTLRMSLKRTPLSGIPSRDLWNMRDGSDGPGGSLPPIFLQEWGLPTLRQGQRSRHQAAALSFCSLHL